MSSSYLWDGANLAQENRGGAYFLYSFLGMQPIALTSAGSSQALETDLVGTVLGVVNTSGTEIARYVGDDFGNPQAVVGSSPNPFRFAGAFLDGETGLYQMRGRYYDPSFGRFLTQDVNPGNPYSYCRNNPTSSSDPSGWAFLWAGSICQVGGEPGLHPSIPFVSFQIFTPSGKTAAIAATIVIYDAVNYWGELQYSYCNTNPKKYGKNLESLPSESYGVVDIHYYEGCDERMGTFSVQPYTVTEADESYYNSLKDLGPLMVGVLGAYLPTGWFLKAFSLYGAIAITLVGAFVGDLTYWVLHGLTRDMWALGFKQGDSLATVGPWAFAFRDGAIIAHGNPGAGGGGQSACR